APEQNLFPGKRCTEAGFAGLLFSRGTSHASVFERSPHGVAPLSKWNSRKSVFPEGGAGICSRLDRASHSSFRRTRRGYAIPDGQYPRVARISDEFGLYSPQPMVEPQQDTGFPG